MFKGNFVYRFVCILFCFMAVRISYFSIGCREGAAYRPIKFIVFSELRVC